MQVRVRSPQIRQAVAWSAGLAFAVGACSSSSNEVPVEAEVAAGAFVDLVNLGRVDEAIARADPRLLAGQDRGAVAARLRECGAVQPTGRRISRSAVSTEEDVLLLNVASDDALAAARVEVAELEPDIWKVVRFSCSDRLK